MKMIFVKTWLGWLLTKVQTIILHDQATLHAKYTIEDFDAKTGELIKQQEFHYNCLLNEGITALLNLLIGAAETAFNNSNANIGVGDSSTAEQASQTGLQASTNKLYKAMDTNYPSVQNQTVTFRSTFLESEANFAWNEITVASGTSDSADNLNRKTQNMGTKTSAVQRVATVAITIA
jgi:hypothetical protein